MSLEPSSSDIGSGAPTERRARKRREAGKLDQEVAPLMSHLAPEVREEISGLIQSGRTADAEKEILDYVVNDEKSDVVRDATRKAARRDKKLVERYTYLLSIIPVAIVLYCIFCLLYTGHIKAPW